MRSSTLKKPILLLSSLLLLTSCGGNNPTTSTSSSDVASSTSVEASSSKGAGDQVEVSGFADAFNKLATLRNYDVETVQTFEDNNETFVYNNYFQPDYVYCDYEGEEAGYAEKNGEIFRFNRYKESFVASDALEKGALWNSENVKTLALPSSIFAGETGDEAIINNKKAKLQWLAFLDLDASYIVDITEAKVTLSGNTLSNLAFHLQFEGVSFVSKIRHINNGGDAEVEEYLETASASTYDPILTYAKEDFALNNFVRVIEDELTVKTEGDKIVWGHEYYLPNYFYTHYNETSGYGIQSLGYLSLKRKSLEGHPDIVFDGSYMFTLTSDLSEMNSFLAAGPAFVTNDYYMPTIMNYPSLMNMWDHNFQFFEPVEGGPYDGVTFVTTDPSILYDFYYYSQIGLLLDEEYATRTLISLSMSIDKGEDEASRADDKIVFLFELKNDGERYRCEYKYERFGDANIQAVEDFAAMFIDAE